MPSLYARRNGMLWCRIKNEVGKWIGVSTGERVGSERAALRFAAEAQAMHDKRRGPDAAKGPYTVRTWSRVWLQERQQRGIRSVGKSESRIRTHILPRLGDMRMDAVRHSDVRSFVRALVVLVSKGQIAPRTVHNIYGDLHTMFADAVIEGHVEISPCVLKRRDLPAKVDKDPEWRTAAVYSLNEVERMISEPAIAVERRVLNALKSCAGLRHGEAAGLRWRHYEPGLQPLGRLLVATSYDTGRTKTEVVRRVPVHPTLAKILAAWKLSHWARVYGRMPNADDLIVPARTMRPLAASPAAKAFKRDLVTLKVRTAAGEHRDRGGHDLRAWFITTCQENGAHRDLLRVITHPGKGDIVSGYTRASWPALCAEVSKLKVSILKGRLLELATQFATREDHHRNRWGKGVGVVGIESGKTNKRGAADAPTSSDHVGATHPLGSAGTERVASLATQLAAAVLDGDSPLARTLAEMIRGPLPSRTARRRAAG